VELVQQVVDGVKLLVNMEKCLEKGEDIESMLPANYQSDKKVRGSYSGRAEGRESGLIALRVPSI